MVAQNNSLLCTVYLTVSAQYQEFSQDDAAYRILQPSYITVIVDIFFMSVYRKTIPWIEKNGACAILHYFVQFFWMDTEVKSENFEKMLKMTSQCAIT